MLFIFFLQLFWDSFQKTSCIIRYNLVETWPRGYPASKFILRLESLLTHSFGSEFTTLCWINGGPKSSSFYVTLIIELFLHLVKPKTTIRYCHSLTVHHGRYMLLSSLTSNDPFWRISIFVLLFLRHLLNFKVINKLNAALMTAKVFFLLDFLHPVKVR